MSETFGRESLNRENSSYIIIINEIGGRVCRRFLVLLFFLRGWKMIAVQLPEHWRDWILKEELGRGSFGVVYRAERKLGEDTFSSAIKVIRIPDSEQEKNAVLLEITDEESRKKYYADTAASFMKEIKTMAQLRGNSYIVSIEDYDVVHDAENVQWTIFIRMEFLESFRSYQISNEIDDELVVRLGIDICHALSLCEEKGIVHRDIKPDNIFYSQTGTFKLGDFGTARRTEFTRSVYSFAGTRGYLAPEIEKNQKYDNRSDIYSLGIVLYKLLNRNRDPFLDTEKKIITSIERGAAIEKRLSGVPLPPPVEGDERIKKIILKACAYDPAERYQNADDFRKDLENVLARENRDNRETPGGHERKKTRTGVLKMILIGAAVCLALFLFLRGGSEKIAPKILRSLENISEKTEVKIFGSASSGENAEIGIPCRVLNKSFENTGKYYPEILLDDSFSPGIRAAIDQVNSELKKSAADMGGAEGYSARITRSDSSFFSFYTFYTFDSETGPVETNIKGYTFDSSTGEEVGLQDLMEDLEDSAEAFMNNDRLLMKYSEDSYADLLRVLKKNPHCWWIGYDGIHLYYGGRESTISFAESKDIIKRPCEPVSSDFAGLFSKTSLGDLTRYYYVLGKREYFVDEELFDDGSTQVTVYNNTGSSFRFHREAGTGILIMKVYYVDLHGKNMILLQTMDEESSNCEIRVFEVNQNGFTEKANVEGYIEDGLISADKFYIDYYANRATKDAGAVLYKAENGTIVPFEDEQGANSVTMQMYLKYGTIIEAYSWIYENYRQTHTVTYPDEFKALVLPSLQLSEDEKMVFSLFDLNGDGVLELLLGNVSYGEFQVMDAFCLVDSEVSRISEDITMGNADCGATLFAGGWISEKENYGSRDFRQRIFRFTGRAAQLSKCYYYFNGRYYKGIDIDIAALEDGTRTYEQNLISQDEYQTAMDSYKKLSINTYELSEENIRAVKTAALDALGESEAYPQRDR